METIRMKTLLIPRLALLITLLIKVSIASPPVPVEAGQCHLLKPDSICRTIGANLNVVFLPLVPGKTLSVVEDEIEFQVEQFINFFSALPLRSSCLAPLLELLCRTAYPDCEIVDGGPVFPDDITLPVLLDKVACTQVAQSCATTFQALAQQSIELFTCDDSFPNNTLVPGYSDYYFEQLEGKPVFPEGSATYTVNISGPGGTFENFALDLTTALPSKFNLSQQCENLQCVEDGFYRVIDCNCVFAPTCPFPAYPSEVYEISWLVVVILGMSSVPFNITIVAHWKRFKQVPFIPVAAVVGLVFVVVDTLLIVVIKYGFSCSAEDADALISLLSFENFEEEWYCTINKGSVHLLQMLINAAVLGIASIYDAVKAAKQGKRVRSSSNSILRNTLIFGYVFLVPLICLVATFTIGSDSTSFRAANELRYAFSCGPRYKEIWQEALFVQCPIILSGVALFVFCARVAALACNINVGSGSVRKYSRFNSKVKVNKEDKKKLRRAKLTVAQRIARRVIVFGTTAAVFSVAFSLVTFVILASLANFDQVLDDFVVCNVGIDFATCSGGDLLTILNNTCNSELTVCGENPSDEVPEAALFALNWVLPAVIPLLFGIMFGINHLRQDFYNAYIWITTCGYEEEVFRTFISDDYLFYNGESGQFSSAVSTKPPPGLVKPPPGLTATPPPPGLGPPGMGPPGNYRVEDDEEEEETVYETVNPDF